MIVPILAIATAIPVVAALIFVARGAEVKAAVEFVADVMLLVAAFAVLPLVLTVMYVTGAS